MSNLNDMSDAEFLKLMMDLINAFEPKPQKDKLYHNDVNIYKDINIINRFEITN